MNTFTRYIPYLLSFIYIFITTTDILYITNMDSAAELDINSFGFLGVIKTTISTILIIILLKNYKNFKSLILENKVLFIILTIFVLSCLVSENRWVSLRRLKNFVGVVIAIIVLVKDGKNIVWSMLSHIVILATVVSYFLIFIMPEYGWMDYENTILPKGIFGHKNFLGIFGAFGCIIMHYNYCIKKKLYYIIVLFACLGLLLLSRSATSLIALTLSYMVYYTVVIISGRVWILMAGISFIILAFLINSFFMYDILSSILGYLGKDITLTGRSTLWGVLLEIGLKKPILGYGYGSFFRGEETAWLTNLMGWNASHAHNGLLQVFLESGLIGVIMACCFLVSFAKRVILYKNPLIINFLVTFIAYNLSEHGLFNTGFPFVATLSIYFLLKKETNV